MASLEPAVVPAAREQEHERAYWLPMHSNKAKTRVARDRMFSQNCSIPPREDSKVKAISVSLCAADLNACVSIRSSSGGPASKYPKTNWMPENGQASPQALLPLDAGTCDLVSGFGGAGVPPTVLRRSIRTKLPVGRRRYQTPLSKAKRGDGVPIARSIKWL